MFTPWTEGILPLKLQFNLVMQIVTDVTINSCLHICLVLQMSINREFYNSKYVTDVITNVEIDRKFCEKIYFD
jgi:hypothetical protein